jgi:CDGSH-type Zn-finger protein
MARIVLKTAHEPAEVTTPKGDTVHVCRCGLSHSEQGLCDGSHKKTLDEKEGVVYEYDKNNTRLKDDESACCGSGGCCSKE